MVAARLPMWAKYDRSLGQTRSSDGAELQRFLELGYTVGQRRTTRDESEELVRQRTLQYQGRMCSERSGWRNGRTIERRAVAGSQKEPMGSQKLRLSNLGRDIRMEAFSSGWQRGYESRRWTELSYSRYMFELAYSARRFSSASPQRKDLYSRLRGARWRTDRFRCPVL
jgi:hypothetical protein